MILQALVQYYEALLARGEIDRPGWSKVNVSWRLDLNPDGSLFDVSPLQNSSTGTSGKKTRPHQLAVPAQVKRSSGVAANFLCDTSSYLLGVDDKGKPERTKACFEASREKHLEILKDTSGEAAAAVRAFFDTWNPPSAVEHPALQPYLSEIYKGGNLIFYYNNKPAANDSAIAAAWQQAYDSASDSDTPTRCSVTGRLAPAARLHGNIQGVRGAQSSGASLVSFNAEAFCSYGHEQGENAPVSTYAMTAYTQALNYLLRSDNVRRIGDVTVVYWVENADPAIAAFAGAMLFGPQEVTITRTAITTESDAQNKTTEMGRKYVVPYGLYRAEGFVSANLARRVTGFSEEDLQMLWQAILNMFENDHSAARGKMAVRELIIFKHASELGNAASYKLFDAVTVKKVDGVAVPRKFSDYTVTVSEDLPEGVTCERLS